MQAIGRIVLIVFAWGWQDGPLFLSYLIWSWLCFHWLNPDLDISQGFRPGHFSFPFGPLLKLLQRGAKRSLWLQSLRLLIRIGHELLNFVWRAFWGVFAILWTHRGLVHWPVLGTLLKSAYLALPILWILHRLKPEIPWTEAIRIYLLSPYFMIWVLSDMGHIIGDYRDGRKKGNKRFVPPPQIAPRGLFFRLVKGYRWY